MIQNVYDNFTDAYYGLLEDIYWNPDFICAPRGQKIKEKLGVRFVIKNPLARLPFIKKRDFAVNYIIAEALWYFSGNDLTSWISYYSKFWEKISDDGKTANSAYGARIFKPHERVGMKQNKSSVVDSWTQWDWVIDELVRDNDSRRAVIHIRSPIDSRMAKLDVPCTLTLQFFLRDDNVYLSVSMRSSDLWLGIANDIPAFTLFQEVMALELQTRLQRPIGLGDYIHQSNSLHIYERNFDAVERVLESGLSTSKPMPKMPSKPPLRHLLKLEAAIRGASDPKHVEMVLKNARETSGESSTPYWDDWVYVLASHRCGKLGDQERQKALLKLTNWNGYHFFNR